MITKMVMSETIKTVCCICGKVIRDGKTIDGKVSHGICDGCLPGYMKEQGLKLKRRGGK